MVTDEGIKKLIGPKNFKQFVLAREDKDHRFSIKVPGRRRHVTFRWADPGLYPHTVVGWTTDRSIRWPHFAFTGMRFQWAVIYRTPLRKYTVMPLHDAIVYLYSFPELIAESQKHPHCGLAYWRFGMKIQRDA
jgi:hypothetical protein